MTTGHFGKLTLNEYDIIAVCIVSCIEAILNSTLLKGVLVFASK